MFKDFYFEIIMDLQEVEKITFTQSPPVHLHLK